MKRKMNPAIQFLLFACAVVLPLPAFAVKLGLGEMGEALLLKGGRVHPARLQAVGFPYLYGNLQAALSHELGV